jgi:hypothetical protein
MLSFLALGLPVATIALIVLGLSRTPAKSHLLVAAALSGFLIALVADSLDYYCPIWDLRPKFIGLLWDIFILWVWPASIGLMDQPVSLWNSYHLLLWVANAGIYLLIAWVVRHALAKGNLPPDQPRAKSGSISPP